MKKRMMIFDGNKWPQRREAVEKHTCEFYAISSAAIGEVTGFRGYRKTGEEQMMLTLDGRKRPHRRTVIEQNPSGFCIITDSIEKVAVFGGGRKTLLIYAAQIDEPFQVQTLEGLHEGKAGDYLAIGTHGEMYPIDVEVFKESYEEVKFDDMGEER